METKLKDRKIGLALGGGGVLGAAHIGVLKAFNELDIPIHHIAGTSIGALISAFFAFGKGWKDIAEIMMDLNWLDASKVSLSQFGILSNEKLGQIITHNIGDMRFDQAEISFAVIATNIHTGEKVIIKEGVVAEAIMASTCVPGVFKPIELDGKLLVDGGIVENVPISPLKGLGADFLVGVALGTGSDRGEPQNIIDILLRAFYFTIETATKLHTRNADLLIKPDLASFNFIDPNQTEDLIKAGYQEAKHVLLESLEVEDSEQNK